MEEKRLYKSSRDVKLAGICGGVAEYFNIDPTIVRLLWVAFTIAGGCGIIGYIICMIVLPNDPNKL